MLDPTKPKTCYSYTETRKSLRRATFGKKPHFILIYFSDIIKIN